MLYNDIGATVGTVYTIQTVGSFILIHIYAHMYIVTVYSVHTD